MRILEFALFVIVALPFAVIEGAFLYDLFTVGVDKSASRFMPGVLVAGAILLVRWGRRLWRLRGQPT